ncbi:MAG: hypothetical protein WAS07_02885 [Micropruina sp.]|nr:hypothetical protein [Micropruina sp.]
MLVFIPMRPDALSAWVKDGTGESRLGFGVTADLLDAFGFTDPTDEEAEYTALQAAGLAGLLDYGLRLIAVAEAGDTQPGEPAAFGALRVGPLPWSAVGSLFAEGDAAAASRVARGLAGVELEQAWDDPQAQELLSAGDLLWHAPTEWGTLV